MENPFYIPTDARGIVVGQTGTGKTTVAKYIIADKANLISLDPKHEFTTFQEYKVVESYAELEEIGNRNKDGFAIIYRPKISELEKMEEVNKVLGFAFQRQNTFVHVTELAAIVKNAMSYPYFLRAIYTQGRSRKVGILGETQRPTNIPLFCLSECEYFWKFFLQKRSDAERMAEFMGEEIEEPKTYPKEKAHTFPHSFYYYRIGMENPKQYIVKL